MAPEARTSVRVTQQFAGATEPAHTNPVTTQVGIAVGYDSSRPGYGPHPGSVTGTTPPASAKNSTAAKDAKGAAAALVVAAIGAVVVAAATEAARFDGTVAISPAHPVHLQLRGGGWATVPLGQLDGNWVNATETAIVTPRDGQWTRLRRSPLLRPGFTYSVLGGAGSSASATGVVDTGPLIHVQFGFFPTQIVGVQFVTAFGWRTNEVDATLFDARYVLELDVYPFAAGRLHAGGFGNIGVATRYEDGVIGGDHHGATWSAGAQLQLDIATFVALTARAGVVDAHGELTREALIGLSVY